LSRSDDDISAEDDSDDAEELSAVLEAASVGLVGVGAVESTATFRRSFFKYSGRMLDLGFTGFINARMSLLKGDDLAESFFEPPDDAAAEPDADDDDDAAPLLLPEDPLAVTFDAEDGAVAPTFFAAPVGFALEAETFAAAVDGVVPLLRDGTGGDDA
jgi:hypothetical protein